MLTTVFLPCPEDETGYVKAIVRQRNLEFMLNLGWVATQAEALDSGPSAHVPDPDKGDGVPGSEDWHRNRLAVLEDKDAIQDYAARCGAHIDKRGTLDTVREKALRAIVDGNG